MKRNGEQVGISDLTIVITHLLSFNLMKSFFQEIYQFRREVLSEAIGTFILVFTGTGAVMVNNISQGAITHLGISFVFGAVVAALIYSL
jgi:aquaporin Z